MNTGMFIFNSNIQISHKFVGYNNSTDHGKAVFKNNKENGSHLLAQPDRTNVQTTNLSDPQHIYIKSEISSPKQVAILYYIYLYILYIYISYSHIL